MSESESRMENAWQAYAVKRGFAPDGCPATKALFVDGYAAALNAACKPQAQDDTMNGDCIIVDGDKRLMSNIQTHASDAGRVDKLVVQFTSALATLVAIANTGSDCQATSNALIREYREEAAAHARLSAENAAMKQLVLAIDQTLRVEAAEYVPAIGDVFTLIDNYGKTKTRLQAAAAKEGE